MNPDATTIMIEVGEVLESKVPEDSEDAEPGTVRQHIGNFRRVLLYTFPDKLESFDSKDKDNIVKALKNHGFTRLVIR